MGTDFSNIGTDFSKLGTDFSAIGTDFRGKGTSFASTEQMYLSQEETLDGHTSAWKEGRMEITKLYGNTDDQARGVGREIVQMVRISQRDLTLNGIHIEARDNKISFRGTATTSFNYEFVVVDVISGHIYILVDGGVKYPIVPSSTFSSLQIYLANRINITMTEGGQKNANTGSATSSGTAIIRHRFEAGETYDIVDSYPLFIDLTATYGSGNEPSTADEFSQRLGFADASKLPPFPYGSSYSAKVTATPPSRNLWDEEWELGTFSWTTGQPIASTSRIRSKNFIPVVGGKTYYIKANDNVEILEYGADFGYIRDYGSRKNTTFQLGNNSAYIKINLLNTTAYANDVCVNLSDSDNGKYSPYIPPKDYPFIFNAPLNKIGDLRDWADTKGNEYHALGRYKFTGEEDFTSYSNNRVFTRILTPSIDFSQGYSTIVLTSLGYRSGVNPYSFNKSVGVEGTGGAVFFRDDDHSTSVDDWRTYLRGLYANGTPLTIVFPLATPTTTKAIAWSKPSFPVTLDTLVTVDSEVKPSMDVRYYAKEKLSLLADQPPYLYGEGAPSANIIPRLWKQFDIHTWDGYNWNGEPSAIGQKYIDTLNGDTYIAVASGYYGLTWQKQ